MPREIPVRIAGVVGLGRLGCGIATCLATHDCRVIGVDSDPQALRQVNDSIAGNLQETAARQPASSAAGSSWQQRFSASGSYADLAECDFVIETVTEDLDVKRATLRTIENAIPPSSPIASNSSSITIRKLQTGLVHPERLIAMHWAEPAHATRFIEIGRGDRTNDSTLQQTLDLARALGKDPCLVQQDVSGLIVNRLGYALYREALYLVESGVADVETIDRAFRNAIGLWAGICGPFRWIDLTGGPELYARAMRNVLPDLCQDEGIPALLQELEDCGARGISNGQGFYQYDEDEKLQWEARIRENIWRVKQVLDEQFPIVTPEEST